LGVSVGRSSSLVSIDASHSLGCLGFSRVRAIYYALAVFYEARPPRPFLGPEASGPFDVDYRARLAGLAVEQGEFAREAFGQQRPRRIALRIAGAPDKQLATEDHRPTVADLGNPYRMKPRLQHYAFSLFAAACRRRAAGPRFCVVPQRLPWMIP
jgi:hypothetical protein